MQSVVGPARVEIHHVGLRALGHTDDEARKGGATGTGCVVRDDDRPINNDTSGDVDQQRPIHEGVVQEGEVVAGVVGDRTGRASPSSSSAKGPMWTP